MSGSNVVPNSISKTKTSIPAIGLEFIALVKNITIIEILTLHIIDLFSTVISRPDPIPFP